MRVLAAERSAHKPSRGWGSSLGRAGVALSGFCRGCNRRAAKPINSGSRRRLHPRQVPDRLRCPAEGRTPPHHPTTQNRSPTTRPLPEGGARRRQQLTLICLTTTTTQGADATSHTTKRARGGRPEEGRRPAPEERSDVGEPTTTRHHQRQRELVRGPARSGA